MPNIRVVFIATVGLAGMLLTFYPTLFSGFTRMQPEAGDILLNNYFLEHSYRWATDADYPFDLWSPGFFYPTPYTLTYSETLLGTAPIYWLLRYWFSETVACQLWVLITYALNFVSMAIVLRWFCVNTLLTAAGAYAFAFGLIRADHLTHQHLMVQYFSPFAIWYAWEFLREPSARRWSTSIGLCTMQVLASLHLGWFLGLGMVIFACYGLIVAPGNRGRVWQFMRSRPMATIVPLLVAGVVVGLYARNFYRGTPGTRAYWEAAYFCPRPDCWFTATSGSLWADHLTLRDPAEVTEKAVFQGFAIYFVFALAGWHAWRHQFPGRGLTLAGIGAGALLALLATNWGGQATLWYFVFRLVPGADAFRAVGRIAFVVYLFGLVGSLVGFQALITERLKRPKAQSIAFAVIAALVMIEQVRPFPESFDKRELFLNRAESLVPHLAEVDAAYVMYDDSMPNYRHEIAAMWAGQWAKVPVINGFSGTQPRGHFGIGARPSVEELVRFLGPDWRGRLAVIECGPPMRRWVYQVEPGGRFWLMDSP
jgi:hypothetical protein